MSPGAWVTRVENVSEELNLVVKSTDWGTRPLWVQIPETYKLCDDGQATDLSVPLSFSVLHLRGWVRAD